jgi:hypothetical protein
MFQKLQLIQEAEYRELQIFCFYAKTIVMNKDDYCILENTPFNGIYILTKGEFVKNKIVDKTKEGEVFETKNKS